jgi:CHAT domain-containing protein
LTLKAQALQFQGNLKEALALLEDDLPSGLPVEVRARKKILQADTLCRLKDIRRAETVLQEVDGLVSNQQPALQAELSLARARCALPNDPTTAKKYFTAASSLSHGRDEFIEATGILNVGLLLLGEEHYDEAISRFLDGLKVTSSPFFRDRLLGDLGFAYSQLGDLKRAASFSQQAVKIAAELGDRKGEEYYLIDVGLEHLAQLEYRESGNSYSDALKIAKDRQDHDAEATCLNNLAQLALRTKELGKAEDYIRQLEALKPTGMHYLDLLLNQAELTKDRQDFARAERLLRQLIAGMSDRQSIDLGDRWRAESDLATVYAEERKDGMADVMFRKAVATAEKFRSQVGSIEYKISFLDRDPFYDEYIRFLISRNRPLDALDVAELGRSPTLSEGLSAGERKPLRGPRLRSIQQKLRTQKSVVLAYWLGWEESYLWAITPTQMQMFRLPAEPEIEKEAETYNREILESDHPEKSPAAEKLYEILIRPAAALISEGSSVIVIPHRKLYNLNFESIVVPGSTPHYWIEDVRVQDINFLSALVGDRLQQPVGNARDLLLIGAPLEADKQFRVLKYAAVEMQKVASRFSSAKETVIAGKDATPRAYLASNPGQFDIVHFVTHGTSSTLLENPLDSSIILSTDPGDPATASDPEGSYRLHGREIIKTPLRARLVTISACYGGGREYSGEGLVGLAWAFMRAGAHQVIAALWEVDDASTPQLMDDFYSEFTQGKPAAEALHQAKLNMLHSKDFHNSPYYWASLQLYTGS